MQGNSISSPTNTMHDGNFRPPPPSMKVADNHKGSLMFTPPQQYSQPQVQQPLSQVNMQRYPQNGPNMNTPVRSHHHPPAIHQMYSSNGNAYTYNGNRKQMSPNDPQVYSPNAPQGALNYVDGVTLPGGRQPLYANAPPKPRRLNSSSGVEDDMMSPDGRPSGEQRDTDNTDDDGGFAEHSGYRRGYPRSNPSMATATYHQPRGANQANIVDETGNVFSNQLGVQMYKQQVPHVQQNQQAQQRNRLPKERRTPETYARGRLMTNNDEAQVPKNRFQYDAVPTGHHASQLQQMNSPLRQPQQTVQQQHTPRQMQQNLQNPNSRTPQQQMQMRNVPNQYPFPNQQFPNQQNEQNQHCVV